MPKRLSQGLVARPSEEIEANDVRGRSRTVRVADAGGGDLVVESAGGAAAMRDQET